MEIEVTYSESVLLVHSLPARGLTLSCLLEIEVNNSNLVLLMQFLPDKGLVTPITAADEILSKRSVMCRSSQSERFIFQKLASPVSMHE